ncbi:MAG: phosphoribosyltransferase [Desulfurococcales archaeon]|nr:phosphoribosyltransferase [Desulfurococcales archaeon]
MARIPVKLVSWDEIVEWSRGLAELIQKSGWNPDIIVAVSRGGFVPARLLCDFLDVTDLLAVQSQHWVEAAKAAEKAILKYPYQIDAEGKRVLVVDDIVDTGDTIELAREFIKRSWKPAEVRTATLQWISSVAKLKPDYYYLEVKEWTWFQYPWTRLEDVTQFIRRILKEDKRAREGLTRESLEKLFEEWYGVRVSDLGFYWDLAIEKLSRDELIEVSGGIIRPLKGS